MKKTLITLVAFVIVGLVGYYLYNRFVLSKSDKYTKQTNINNNFIATSQADKEAIYAVTNNFFTKYISCIKNPPTLAKGNPSTYCQDNTGFTSSFFVSNLKKGGLKGVDPILCAQNIPDEVDANTDIKVDGNNATTNATEKFSSQGISVSVSLIKVNGIWKVDNITCPKS